MDTAWGCFSVVPLTWIYEVAIHCAEKWVGETCVWMVPTMAEGNLYMVVQQEGQTGFLEMVFYHPVVQEELLLVPGLSIEEKAWVVAEVAMWFLGRADGLLPVQEQS